ncbi:MAG: DUF1553 domain-containing protein, partial [Prosthecobacter sp.]
DHAPYQIAKASLDRANAQLKEVTAAAGKLNVMVLAERKEPRDTHILVRGVWDKKGDKVTQGVPAAIAPWPEGLAKDRLGLAKWITSKDNPLTARVIKHLITRIVTSETYQQDSAASPELLVRDPQNRLLARGPRFRLPAWMLRDAALAASGLLNPALGGPPVRPYQPDGVWEEIFMGRYTYEPSEGAAQHRRTLYAFWRRSIAPTFLFDSAQRRVCEVSMTRTNTPLQALTLLNDRTVFVAAKSLSQQMLKLKDEPQRLDWLCQRVLSRKASANEQAVLIREWQRARDHYQKAPQEAAKYLDQPVGKTAQLADLAAGTLIATLVMNLDEAITHE